MAVPATMIYFTGYDHLKDALGYSESDPSTRYIPVVAGVLARSKSTCHKSRTFSCVCCMYSCRRKHVFTKLKNTALYALSSTVLLFDATSIN